MSFYRQRWRVELEGHDEPLVIATDARDSQAIPLKPGPDGTPEMPMGMPLKIVHNALLRTGVDDVPRDFQKFLAAVLDANEITEEGDQESADPTRAAHLDA